MIYLAVLLAQLCDLLTFLIAVRMLGIGAEQNPLQRAIYEAWGPAGSVVAKVGLASAMCLCVALLPPKFRLAGALLCIGAGLIGAGGNTWSAA